MSTPSPSPGLLAVFEESYPHLVRFIARRTGSRQDAHDLAHDVWLRLADRPAQQEQVLHARAYIWTVADNLVFDHLRRHQRTAERFGTADTLAPAALWHDVARQHEHRQALQCVCEVIDGLAPRSRDIFLAHRLDGTSHAELALRHGVSVKTIEREVTQALDAVEASLHRWRGEAAPARQGRRRALSTLLLGCAGVGTGGIALLQAWRQWVPSFSETVASAHGRTLSRPLPDGSELTLDADSRVDIAYYAARRAVHLLAGSAFFAVVRDTQRPFTVLAQGHRITVLGTRFEVALQPDGGVRVAVESGQVRVTSSAGDERVLGAGEGIAIDAARRLSVTYRAAQAEGPVASWREGWVDFRHTPLGEVVARLARYTRHGWRVEAGAAQLPVIGRVRTGASDAWLQLLPGSLPVRLRPPAAGTSDEWAIVPRI
ncbi:MAG: iron dicitrate transport regulator FecR [Variovorax paradoxus]|uniref:Iron dicitrate transport regulator FecR n=1 Tax=Variovorax paradoxus TaxID=34073 RepID=A0A2W5QAT9_VARPD|nr:MAG: iron dicitrate transport regulator FecR [Variovorax paradoxus]